MWSDALGPAAYIGRARTVLLRNIGAALSPFNAFLFLQGVETLPLRIERHNEQRARGRAAPRGAPGGRAGSTTRGCESSPYHEVAQRTLRGGYGALVTFGVKGGARRGPVVHRAT